ncbi:MAG: hypothetical protein EUB_01653 [Eubacterium sp.]|uniref:cohesin domain-containing protein n=1 Tax=Eubacterium sp. TaxID=142586 RepID=UPI00305F0750
MKSKTSFLIVLLLITAIIFTPAVFAQQGETNISKTEENDMVIYSLNLAQNSNIQAADFVLSYKGEKLEFVEIKNGPLASAENTMVARNHVAEEKKIYCSYASLNPNENGGTILNVYFKKISNSSEQPVVGIEVKDQYNGNNELMSEKLITGDASVAAVDTDKSINDSDAPSTALEASVENIPIQIDDKAGETSEEAAVENNNVNDMKSNANTSSNQTMISVIIVGVILVLLIVVAVAVKKNKKNPKNS